MKKFCTILCAALMSMSVMAGEHEIGAIVGGLNGVSYKYWFTDQLAVQADLAVGLTQAASGLKDLEGKYQVYDFSMYDFTLNPNFLYHIALPADVKLYAGGGFNIGFMNSPIDNTYAENLAGKFGANAIIGAQYNISGVPLSLSLDFRPGYGLGFKSYENHHVEHFNFFDWKLGFAVRYCL